MAITKQAKNLTVKVKNRYQLFVGEKLEKVAETLNIESQEENLIIVSNKKINAKGNK